MDKVKEIREISDKLLEYAKENEYNKLKGLYFNYSQYGWKILARVVLHTFNTCNILLLNILYEIDDNMDKYLLFENNYTIFKNSIITNNVKFFENIMSVSSIKTIYFKNFKKIINFVINGRYKFIPIIKDMDIEIVVDNIYENIMEEYGNNSVKYDYSKAFEILDKDMEYIDYLRSI